MYMASSPFWFLHVYGRETFENQLCGYELLRHESATFSGLFSVGITELPSMHGEALN